MMIIFSFYQWLFPLLQKLDKIDVNCDSVKQYQIMYQIKGEANWQQILASSTNEKRTIGNLRHSTEYTIRVVVVNNMDIEASSPPVDMMTQAEGRSSNSTTC